jgi:ATP:cob(I)alamin adenosyltransferase
VIGIAREFVAALVEHERKDAIASTLEWIQSRLLDVGSCIATPPTSSDAKLRRTEFSAEHVQVLEDRIDELDADLPSLTMFILPSGGLAASHLHLARCVCRRAERSTVAVEGNEENVDGEQDTSLASVKVFLNRLSDYLFTAARMCAVIDGGFPNSSRGPRRADSLCRPQFLAHSLTRSLALPAPSPGRPEVTYKKE